MLQKSAEYIVVLITAKDTQEAQGISQALLDQHLIACANIVKPVHSLFWWEAKIDEASEVLLILKTQRVLFNQIVKVVKARHSYSVPEILALPVIEGNPDYLKWIDESVAVEIQNRE